MKKKILLLMSALCALCGSENPLQDIEEVAEKSAKTQGCMAEMGAPLAGQPCESCGCLLQENLTLAAKNQTLAVRNQQLLALLGVLSKNIDALQEKVQTLGAQLASTNMLGYRDNT